MKILLVDDHDLVRYGLRKILEDIVEDPCVIEAGSLERGSALYAQERGGIGLVVLDLNLPDSRGLAVVRRFMQRHPEAPVVVLSGSVDEAIASEASSIGAMAFLHKSSDIGELRTKLAAILGSVRRPAPMDGAVPKGIPDGAQARRLSLGGQDVRILDLMLQGSTNREIAEATGLAVGTTKNRVSGLLAVFGVSSRAKLIALFH